MNEEIPDWKRRCKALIDAKIEDPSSIEGIKFCAGDFSHESQCPYDYCVVLEHKINTRQLKAKELATLALDLEAHKVSREDIALIIGKNLRTVIRYLKR